MDVRRIVGANVRKYRLAANLSQEELALRVELVDQGYISGLEVGRRNPTAIMLWLIARALEIDPGQLFSTDGFTEKWAQGPVVISSTRSGRKRV